MIKIFRRSLTNPIKALSENVPSARSRIGNLRDNLDSPEMISNVDRAALTSKFWSKIWSRRISAPSLTSRTDYLKNYAKKVNPSL
jgi:CHAD domain-containing protein